MFAFARRRSSNYPHQVVFHLVRSCYYHVNTRMMMLFACVVSIQLTYVCVLVL